jgi:hypothetical protein
MKGYFFDIFPIFNFWDQQRFAAKLRNQAVFDVFFRAWAKSRFYTGREKTRETEIKLKKTWRKILFLKNNNQAGLLIFFIWNKKLESPEKKLTFFVDTKKKPILNDEITIFSCDFLTKKQVTK